MESAVFVVPATTIKAQPKPVWPALLSFLAVEPASPTSFQLPLNATLAILLATSAHHIRPRHALPVLLTVSPVIV